MLRSVIARTAASATMTLLFALGSASCSASHAADQASANQGTGSLSGNWHRVSRCINQCYEAFYFHEDGSVDVVIADPEVHGQYIVYLQTAHAHTKNVKDSTFDLDDGGTIVPMLYSVEDDKLAIDPDESSMGALASHEKTLFARGALGRSGNWQVHDFTDPSLNPK